MTSLYCTIWKIIAAKRLQEHLCCCFPLHLNCYFPSHYYCLFPSTILIRFHLYQNYRIPFPVFHYCLVIIIIIIRPPSTIVENYPLQCIMILLCIHYKSPSCRYNNMPKLFMSAFYQEFLTTTNMMSKIKQSGNLFMTINKHVFIRNKFH